MDTRTSTTTSTVPTDRTTSPTTSPSTGPAPAAGPRVDAAAGRHDTALRVTLWVLLLLAAAGNVAASSLGVLALSIPLGLAVLGLGAALVVLHRRTRAAG